MNNVLIRLATLDDCSNLSRLKKDVWETTYRGLYPDDKIDNYNFDEHEKKFKNIILDDTKYLYVAETNNKLIAYIEFGLPMRPYKAYTQEIGLFYISKEYQKQGLGTKLFKLAYDNLKNSNENKFFISCHKYNFNAINFYKKMGGILIDTDDDDANDNCPQVKFHYDLN